MNGQKIPHQGKYDVQSIGERVAWLENYTSSNYKQVKGDWIENDIQPDIFKNNVDNLIGTAEVPVGIAGPLLFSGVYAKGKFVCPLATTEGGLVASTSRGAKAITMSGGVKTSAGHQAMRRAPIFILSNISEALTLGKWLETLTDRLQQNVVSKRTKHGTLHKIVSFFHSEIVAAMFIYETGDAAGQNMTTDATQSCLDWIAANYKKELPGVEIKKIHIEGGLGGDKMHSQLSGFYGRGTSVSASCLLTESNIRNVLRTSPSEFLKFMQVFLSFTRKHSVTMNSFNTPNIVAAIFTATGQDIACVSESSVAYMDVEAAADPDGGTGILVKLLLPSLTIGTVGGGTALPTQKECLDMIGCSGSGKVRKFAEIIAGFSLAQELSLAAALCNGEFANAMNKLARNRPGSKL